MADNGGFTQLETHDGALLFCQSYPAADALGVIISIHDYGQHSGAYEAAHRLFVEARYSVYTLDLRGHGKSAGERASITSFDDYLDDLDLLIARVKDREGERPFFLLGQGMGALIALRFVGSRRPKFHGLILCGGLPLLPTNAKEKLVSQYAGILLPHIEASEEARQLLLASSLTGELKTDELAFRGAVKAKTVAEINAANSLGSNDQEFLSFPVLCLASERHALVMEKLHNKLLTHDKTLIEYPGKSFAPLLGEDRKKVVQEIVEWCQGHLDRLEDEDEWGDPEDDGL